jgi:hypothetical protein
MRSATIFAVFTVLALSTFCQTAPPAGTSQNPNPAAANAPTQNPPQQESKRLFGIIPNYRSAPPITNYKPLTTKQKYKIALNDSFDRGAVILALAFAGRNQLANSTPSFGQGMSGFAKYFAAGYSDVILANMMTEAIYPSLLHQDPRYFRKGSGGNWGRLGHAMYAIVCTRKDSGGKQFNYSEIAGNATAVGISNAYYPDNRTLSSNVSRISVQIGIDMAGNIMKEFWPDVSKKLSRKPKATGAPAPPAPAANR